ncbi:unnamed protein product [Fraxinus pennsylvanica]|uniref:Uncharacterized protein n=1 Tax=Fraxinus pennsylvanica TaxID=56036 RepID=A0AAD2EAT0_9LAMI|nr:unnamed protein product [Fraxinus pennsylvanica]
MQFSFGALILVTVLLICCTGSKFPFLKIFPCFVTLRQIVVDMFSPGLAVAAPSASSLSSFWDNFTLHIDWIAGFFLLFFATATFNDVVISLFMTLVVVGGFLAPFFSCVAAINVGALSIAVCVISTATTVSIIAVLIATDVDSKFCYYYVRANVCDMLNNL